MRGEPRQPTMRTCRGVRRDGTYIWVDNIITVVTWKGETTIQCTVVDISERTQVGAALQRSEAQHLWKGPPGHYHHRSERHVSLCQSGVCHDVWLDDSQGS